MPTPASTLVEQILLLAPHTEIVHHLPGRIRLKILASGFKLIQSVDLKEMMRHIPGVLSVRTNWLARSAVIDYDATVLPSDLWQGLGQLRHDPALTAALRERLLSLWG